MVEALRPHTDVVYDITMQYEPCAPDLWTLFRVCRVLLCPPLSLSSHLLTSLVSPPPLRA